MILPTEKLSFYFNYLPDHGIECNRTISDDVKHVLYLFRHFVSNYSFRFVRFEYEDFYVDIRRVNTCYEYKVYIYPITPKLVF